MKVCHVDESGNVARAPGLIMAGILVDDWPIRGNSGIAPVPQAEGGSR